MSDETLDDLKEMFGIEEDEEPPKDIFELAKFLKEKQD